MIGRTRRVAPAIAVGLLICLLLPPLQHALTGTMTTQMLVQIPLLIAVGWLLRAAVPPRIVVATDAWNYGGITGLLLATFAAAFWMLPRWLDASVNEPMVAAAKFVTVPLLIGLPLGLSWPRMGFVVRGLFLSELIAMFFRLGWLYMVSPVRLCSNYLLNDQKRSGQYMLVIGTAILLWVAIKLLWGRFDSLSDDRSVPPLND